MEATREDNGVSETYTHLNYSYTEDQYGHPEKETGLIHDNWYMMRSITIYVMEIYDDRDSEMVDPTMEMRQYIVCHKTEYN